MYMQIFEIFKIKEKNLKGYTWSRDGKLAGVIGGETGVAYSGRQI